MQITRTIALALSEYAHANGGQFPQGSSSTAVFQKLLDGNYVSDPSLFYLLMPGKTQPAGGRLQPQNVCYDVTSGVDASSPDGMPAVYVTGFRLEYRPAGQAISLVRPFPVYAYSAESWMKWLTGADLPPVSGLAVADTKGQAQFLQGRPGPDGFGLVPHVLPPDFDAHGKTYRQLTPDGRL